MSNKEFPKTHKKHFIRKHSAKLCFALALILIFVSYIVTFPTVQKSLAAINTEFVKLENFIAGLNHLIAFFIILFLFLFKSFVPIIPFSVLFISSGMVFSPFIAIIVNAFGFALLVSTKFWWGRRFGGSRAVNFLKNNEAVSRFMNFNGTGNKWMLVLLRFIPFIPLGMVSRAYGTTDIAFLPYVSLSVLGFLPRLVLWSVVGINIFNPFTPSFIVPIIVLLIISGIALLIYNTLSE